MENKNRFFNAATQGDTLTMAIYDAIGADLFGDGITASQVQNALKGDHKNVTVRVNSPGGDAFEGVAIYNLLNGCGKPVNVIVDGMAASAASIICMAGESITMNAGTVMMIHDAQGLGMGNADEMRKMADTLDTVTGAIADIYVANTGMSKDEVLDLMHAETWMSADEAKQMGFATAVSDAAKVANSYDLSKFKFKNAPKELTEMAALPEMKVKIDLAVKTKRVDGEDLTAEDFIYAGNPHDVSTWSLPWHFSTEEKTESHLRDALARFDQDEVIPKAMRAEAHAKLVRIAKQHGIDVSDSDAPKNAAPFDFSLAMKRIEMERRK